MHMDWSPKRLLIVEDHPAMRASYAFLFEREAALVVGGMVASAEEALTHLEATPDEERYDAVLVDVSLPGIDGIELVRRLHRDRPDLKTVVVTGHHEPHYEKAAAEVGADAFVRKGHPRKIVQAVHAVLQA